MTRLERREYALRKLTRKKGKKASSGGGKNLDKLRTNMSFEDSEALPYTAPDMHHHISRSRNFHMNIMAFLSSNQGDPAISVRLYFLAPHQIMLTNSIRISVQNLKSMFLHEFIILAGLVLVLSTQMKNTIKLILPMSGSIVIKLCESTIQPTMSGVVKTHSAHGKGQTS